MRTLFLQAPSYDGFDGGAGSRYQARREMKSYWYPTWLAQLAALVPDSKLIDAPPHGISLEQIVGDAHNYDLAVLHTSTPSFGFDTKCLEALKEANADLKAGFVGAKVEAPSFWGCPARLGRRLRKPFALRRRSIPIRSRFRSRLLTLAHSSIGRPSNKAGSTQGQPSLSTIKGSRLRRCTIPISATLRYSIL
jgi:hypothetical protein